MTEKIDKVKHYRTDADYVGQPIDVPQLIERSYISAMNITIHFSYPLLCFEPITCFKAYSMLGIIKRNFKYMDKVAFLCLYKGLVRSTVEYNSSVWNPSYMGQIEELEKVQRRATKLFRECKKSAICRTTKIFGFANTEI